MDLGLKGKSVFVAGSSRGIGKGIGAIFLDEGAKVFITGRDKQSVDEAVVELSVDRADRVGSLAGDLTDPLTVERAKRRILDAWGAVDCLICNIGSGSAPNRWDPAREDWDAAFAVNLWATIGLVNAFVPEMVQRRRGSVVFISSIAGIESLGAPIPYAAAKGALERYSKDLSRRLGEFGVRVNTVAPGNILFPGGSWQRKLDANPEIIRSMIVTEVPLGRFGKPEEIGAAVAFLASDQAAFMTGSCLVIDGGQTRS